MTTQNITGTNTAGLRPAPRRLTKKQVRGRKLGFAQAVKTAAARDQFEGEWTGYMGPVDGRNGFERAIDRLVNGLPYQRDEMTDRAVMGLLDHERLLHLEQHGGSSRGHPAYYRQRAVFSQK